MQVPNETNSDPHHFTRDKVWPPGGISALEYLHFLPTYLCVSGPALAVVAEVPQSLCNRRFPAHDLYLEGEKSVHYVQKQSKDSWRMRGANSVSRQQQSTPFPPRWSPLSFYIIFC